MKTLVRVMQAVTAAGFITLAASSFRLWVRDRDRPRLYLSVALGSLACASIVGEVGRLTDYRYSILLYVSLIAFLSSGYFLLLFRHWFIPYRKGILETVGAVFVVLVGILFVLQPPYGEDPTYTTPEWATIVAIILAWCASLAEPAFRFRVASRNQPRVQRARLRALSLACTIMVLILLVAIVAQPRSDTSALVFQMISLPLIPLLWAAVMPPRWLRRAWREPEEASLRQARNLILYASDGQTLATRAVEWAGRLVGASEVVLLDRDGQPMAGLSEGAGETRWQAIAAGYGDSAVESVGLVEGPEGRAIVVPIPTEEGVYRLIALAGPYAMLFGTDEVQRLEEYSELLGVALHRTRLTEEMHRVDAARARFIANAAHELRTPLTAMVGLSTLFKERDVPLEDMKEGLGAIARQSERMHALVNNLLDLTQVDSGRLKLDLRPVQLDDLMSRLLAVTPPPQGKRVERHVGTFTVRADAGRLEQVLTNLLSNAYRYGGNEISVEADARNGHVEMRIADNGPGVPSDVLAHLFEPFHRGPNATGIEGSGLGLAIVRTLVDALGGNIRYDPVQGGARFIVELQRA